MKLLVIFLLIISQSLSLPNATNETTNNGTLSSGDQVNEGLSVGIIVLIVIGTIIGLCCLGFGSWFFIMWYSLKNWDRDWDSE